MKSLAEPLVLLAVVQARERERDRRMPADSAELIDLVMRGKPTLNLPSSPVARREREPLPLAPRAYGCAPQIFLK